LDVVQCVHERGMRGFRFAKNRRSHRLSLQVVARGEVGVGRRTQVGSEDAARGSGVAQHTRAHRASTPGPIAKRTAPLDANTETSDGTREVDQSVDGRWWYTVRRAGGDKGVVGISAEEDAGAMMSARECSKRGRVLLGGRG
jgi:hypothetical protein